MSLSSFKSYRSRWEASVLISIFFFFYYFQLCIFNESWIHQMNNFNKFYFYKNGLFRQEKLRFRTKLIENVWKIKNDFLQQQMSMIDIEAFHVWWLLSLYENRMCTVSTFKRRWRSWCETIQSEFLLIKTNCQIFALICTTYCTHKHFHWNGTSKWKTMLGSQENYCLLD